MKKISIIGNIILDKYYKHGRKKENYGGITYILSALSVLFGREADIFPISIINRDHFKKAVPVLKKYKNVNTGFIKKTDRPMNYFSMYFDKEEKYYNYYCYLNNIAIPYCMVKPHLDSDLIIVTYITGDDIRFKDLTKLSENAQGLVFGDIHHFIYENPVNGIKPFKQIKFRKEWVDCFDIIQGTAFEWEFLLKNSPLNKYTENLVQYPIKEMEKRFSQAAKHILKGRPEILLLTDGKFGAFAFYKKENRIVSSFKKPRSFKKIKDTTGCGDTFSGAFLYEYMKTGDIKKALNFAVYLSSCKTQVFGLWDSSPKFNRYLFS